MGYDPVQAVVCGVFVQESDWIYPTLPLNGLIRPIWYDEGVPALEMTRLGRCVEHGSRGRQAVLVWLAHGPDLGPSKPYGLLKLITEESVRHTSEPRFKGKTLFLSL